MSDFDDDGLPDWDDVPDHIIAFENSEAGRSAREYVEAYHAECARLQAEEQEERERIREARDARRAALVEAGRDPREDYYGFWD
jgi:hypothetical protein